MDTWKLISPVCMVAGAVLVNRCRVQPQASVPLLFLTHLTILTALLGSIFPILATSQPWTVMVWVAIGFVITFFGTMLLVTIGISNWVWVGVTAILLLIPTIREEMIRLLGGAATVSILLWLSVKIFHLLSPDSQGLPSQPAVGDFEDVSEDWFAQAGLEVEFESVT